jgi:hypothetical protein
VRYANFRLGLKSLPEAADLSAYLSKLSVRNKVSFIALTPAAFTIKLFSDVIVVVSY